MFTKRRCIGLASTIGSSLLGAMDFPKSKSVVIKNVIHFFERLAASLLEEEEDMAKGSKSEGAENHVEAPLDVLKCRGSEECEGEVADPVEDCGNGHGFGADV